MTDFEDRARAIVVDILGVKPAEVTRDATFDALGADSLDMLEIAMACEEIAGVEISDSQWKAWTTFGDMVDFAEDQARA